MILSKNGYNALMCASDDGFLSGVEMLLNHNAQIDLKDNVSVAESCFAFVTLSG